MLIDGYKTLITEMTIKVENYNNASKQCSNFERTVYDNIFVDKNMCNLYSSLLRSQTFLTEHVIVLSSPKMFQLQSPRHPVIYTYYERNVITWRF